MHKRADSQRRRPPSPHDALFRGIFAAPPRAAELLRHLLPWRLARRFDWSSLRAAESIFVDETLRDQRADLLFTVRLWGSRTLLYLLLEHKSGPYRLTVFQVARYVVRIWERWLADHPYATSLPAVLPFVLFHGPRRWRGSQQLSKLVALPPSLRSWRGALPRFAFEIEDLNKRGVRRLARGRLPLPSLLPLLHLEEVRGSEDTVALLQRWSDYYRELLALPGGEPIVRRLVSYVAAVSRDDPRRLRAAYKRIHRTTEANYMHYMTTAERMRRKGKREGRLEGRLDLLKVQLEERFGPLPQAVLSRLAAATATELDRWARRILKAKTLRATLS